MENTTDCNYLFTKPTAFIEKYRKRVRCDECIYSETQNEYDPKYLRCTKHINTICEAWMTCKSGKKRK